MPRSDQRSVLLAALAGAYGPRGWQGPTLSGSLRGVTPAMARFRPARGRRCIWEHVLHAAYWKYAVAAVVERYVLAVTEPEGFPRSPSNWPRVPERPDAKAWRADRALLAAMHGRLARAAAEVGGSDLSRPPSPAHRWPLVMYLVGAAAHDAYHCGQVQLLKRLARCGR